MSAFCPLFINRLSTQRLAVPLFCALLVFLFPKAAPASLFARLESDCC